MQNEMEPDAEFVTSAVRPWLHNTHQTQAPDAYSVHTGAIQRLVCPLIWLAYLHDID